MLNPRRIWDTLLAVAVMMVSAVSVLFILMPIPALRALNPLFFADDAPAISGAAAEGYVAFVFGVLGAVMLGWMSALLFIIRGPLRRRSRGAWWQVVASVAIWFVPDCAVSLWWGYPENAAGKVAFAILFAVPLIGMRSELVDDMPSPSPAARPALR